MPKGKRGNNPDESQQAQVKQQVEVYNKLIGHRDALTNQISRFKAFLETKCTHLDSPELKVDLNIRLSRIEAILSEFEHVQLQIEQVCLESEFEESKQQEQERENFENLYYNTVANAKLIQEKINSLHVTAPADQLSSSLITNLPFFQSGGQYGPRLPPIPLPKFNGSYETWTNFRDTFVSLIDKNSQINNVEKFYYLQSTLQGEAAQIISSLAATQNSYTTAWSMLQERYENKRAIIHSHVKCIFELPTIKDESHVHLRKLLDSFQSHFKSLQNLQEPVDQWCTLLIYLLNSKLDFKTRKEWETFSKDIDRPTMEDFLKFLSQRCRFLESLDFKLNTKKGYTKIERPFERKTLISQVSNARCPICEDTHFVYACKKFLDLPISNRFYEAKRANLCTNCLRPGHRNGECRSTHSCKTCQGKHHTLLHNQTSKFNCNQSKLNQSESTRDSNSNSVKASSSRNPTQGERVIYHGSVCTANNSSRHHVADDNINFGNSNPTYLQEPVHSTIPNVSQTTQNLHCAIQNPNSFVLLSTASIYVYDKNHKPILCKAILDNGSQSNFIVEGLFKKLDLPYQSVNISVSGIGPDATSLSKRTQLHIKSSLNNYSVKMPALVIKKITEITPQFPVDLSRVKIPDDLPLADSDFHNPSEIDILIGASLFYELLGSKQIGCGKGNPILQETKLGWVVSGPISLLANVSYRNAPCQSLVCTNVLQNNLERFWLTEETTELLPQALSKEELECEEHFQNTTRRDKTGRFIVKLPTKPAVFDLGDSLQPAIKRFYTLEQKLDKNPEVKLSYTKFINEYLSLGHMSEVDPNACIDSKYPTYYLPHHCVEKIGSTTTRLRVVFDASCISSTGLSLNDTLKIGPNVQNDLFSIILKFRMHNYVLIGDIAKMYRQILMDPKQRSLQRIVWRNNPNEKIRHFNLNTVTYGMASSSYLATRCIQEIANLIIADYPNEGRVLSSDCYVDDILTGTNTKEELITLGKNLVNLLKGFGFDLRKFSSNDLEVLSDLNPSGTNDTHFILNDSQSTKTLGISWNSEQDLFIYTSTIDSKLKPVTKRTILSLISQIFDPLGLLGPMVIQVKILLQKLWLLKLNWDEPVPSDIFRIWNNFTYHLSLIDYFKIPRQVTIKNTISHEFHGFSDASINAFGACIYLRSIDSFGNIAVNLLCAKSRVAPLKAVTLPHLELCGALVLSKLMKKTINALNCNPIKINYYTDSTIVLCWLCLEPRQLKTYVCNRVSEIQQITDVDNWYHITSAENPADIISRGINPQELKSSLLWWHGPSFLSQPSKIWINQNHISKFHRKILDPETLEINSKSIILASVTTARNLLFDKFSDYNKLVNTTAYCIRFIQNSRTPKSSRQIGHLTPLERQKALTALIIMAQNECFSSDIQALKSRNGLMPQSKLKSLNPFIDINGVIRVGGRLENSSLDYQAKHPMLLPQSHPLTRLIISHEHQRNFHPGIQSTLSFIRQKFWPIHGKSAVKAIIRKCVTCYKLKPKPLSTLMGDLPEPRVNPSRPFLHTGVDYAGPFLIKNSHLRNRKLIKAYLCAFVCMATKAVHFELVTNLTSQGFLAMLKRFVSRRGLCQHLYSDNGTSFVGANSELREIYKFYETSDFQVYIKTNMIQFHFIPARSPHFGGLWEGVVKSFKHHLRRVLSDENPLTYEEFYTFVVQVEAILNSRPLLPISNDPKDFETLTPGHFLVGHPLNMIPDIDLQQTACNRLTRYQMLQSMVQHFWRKWSEQYLHTLHERSKWQFKDKDQNLLGSLVLLKDENNPPSKWTTARIIAVHPGKDGITRVVSVRTSNGSILRRSVVKVCMLPIYDDQAVTNKET